MRGFLRWLLTRIEEMIRGASGSSAPDYGTGYADGLTELRDEIETELWSRGLDTEDLEEDTGDDE